jgi:hypothetical protein
MHYNQLKSADTVIAADKLKQSKVRTFAAKIIES